MSEVTDRLKDFVAYWERLSGDEKGEAQVFCDRLFKAFGHAGYKEAGATLETRVHRKGEGVRTGFADLVWKPRFLLEMKRRGEKLQLHFRQAFDYWVHLVPNRPRYVVLCNFDEFWIYDFDKQIDQPVDVVAITDLPRRYLALSFLFPDNPEPQFGNDREGVTREAAELVGRAFLALVERGEDRARAQRFALQCVVAMFAEDVDLMPRGTVRRLCEAARKGESSFDLFGGLFRQMNSMSPARAGRYKDIPYFNGGLFATVDPIELTITELNAIDDAATRDWSLVNPAIFGTLFQSSMDLDRRHTLGAHFTSERDIMAVIGPTISEPWERRIDAARNKAELLALRTELLQYRVLDPACGSGNFLYLAYRELVRIEIRILLALRSRMKPAEFTKHVPTLSLISPRQLFGMDVDPFAVELAKISLVFGKKLALDEAVDLLDRSQVDLDLHADHALPLENLDGNCIVADALFAEWPKADAIIGNPPFQSKNKMQQEYGRAYLNRLRKRYPDVPGRADYCVYWFRLAHDKLPPGARAGLVGTNTIRQNYSREGGLDYIVAHGGTITDAVASQVWSGDAAVHVSIVNWVKGDEPGMKRLRQQRGDAVGSPWDSFAIERINSALTAGADATGAKTLRVAAASGCHQGQTHGHRGFLVPREEAEAMLAAEPRHADVLHPFLTADELLGTADSLPERYVIDFGSRDLLASKAYKQAFDRVQRTVLPDREAAAVEEAQRSHEARDGNANARVNRHHANFLAQWWQLSYRRGELMGRLATLPRYVVCGQVTKRPIFEFVDHRIHPNAALMVFPFADDYSFGILQSSAHWEWFVARCSTLKGDFRYTSNTVWDTFPWPQDPDPKLVAAVGAAAVRLRDLRWSLRIAHKLSLRDLYRSAEQPGKHPLKDAHASLDAAVRKVYGFSAKADLLQSIFALNVAVAERESTGQPVLGPGYPDTKVPKGLISADCVQMPGN